MPDAVAKLTDIIRAGLKDDNPRPRDVLKELFGGRYHTRHLSKEDSPMIRDAMVLGASDDETQGVPFAGLIHPDNPNSGPYGGMSFVWFPKRDGGSVVGLGIGTRGLAPDEGILMRPGHRRRVAALRKTLAEKGVSTWSKPDPANLGMEIPELVLERFPEHVKALKRYSKEMYLIAEVTPEHSHEQARHIVQSILDLYSHERGWKILSEWAGQREDLMDRLHQDSFGVVTGAQVYERLLARHFVILQGPPGTGKTRMARQVLRTQFQGNGTVVQFHPAVTYEDFVVGLSPDIGDESTLRFGVRPGSLVEACSEARKGPYLLVVDEINRADLSKVLGEAIYLFEPSELKERPIRLPHAVQGSKELALPDTLYVLGTMNTADRAIASIDLAIRRRFTFMTMMPELKPVQETGISLAVELFKALCDAFVEHAPNEALTLMPGHSYFIASNEEELKKRLEYELLPLLDEYLREGFL
ncbi:McrB family protein [Chloroflexota bacterium]